MNDDLHDAVAQLVASLADLEKRVSALEHPALEQQKSLTQVVDSVATTQATEAPLVIQEASLLSILGKATLGMAGAYLLRALAESSMFPRIGVVVAAIAYAVLWLVIATRVPVEAWLASIAYAGISILILVPMLWELTLRFGILSNTLTSGVLGAYVFTASALAWKRHFAAVAGMVSATGSIAALILGIVAHNPAPFTVAILLMVTVSEFAITRDRNPKVRTLVAVAADIAVWALIYIYSGPQNSHSDYKSINPMLLPVFGPMLLIIYSASATAQAMLKRRGISFFETVQTLIAFLLATWGMLSFWSESGAFVLGTLCLASSAVGYTGVFVFFGHARSLRNFHVYATGSAALLLAGGYLCLPLFWLVLYLSISAIVATALGVRTKCLTLEFHGFTFLTAGTFSSGLFAYTVHALTGTIPASPRGITTLVSGCAALCYFIEVRLQNEQWMHRILHLLSASLVVVSVTALLVWILVGGLTAMAIIPDTPQIAVLRTLTTCAMALILSWLGSVWQRTELVWLAYATLVFIASKLLFEDMHHGHLGFLAGSLSLYAVTLLLIPRLVRLKRGIAKSDLS